jgi:DNA-binding transcriptional ArsR family regulator
MSKPSALFAALGDDTRLSLVRRLSEGESLSIAALATGRRLTRQAVTKHLTVLHRAGLVRAARRGRERLWTLQPLRLDEARRDLELISAQWDAALARLRAFVESKT